VLLVPGDPAGSRAEPGVLTAWREYHAALLTGPGIGHLPMLRDGQVYPSGTTAGRLRTVTGGSPVCW
jgi:hypothetical protein